MSTPTPAQRVATVAANMDRTADTFDACARAVTCEVAAEYARLCAQHLHAQARILMGDIGDPKREVTVEPIEVPVEVPEPQKVPV